MEIVNFFNQGAGHFIQVGRVLGKRLIAEVQQSPDLAPLETVANIRGDFVPIDIGPF